MKKLITECWVRDRNGILLFRYFSGQKIEWMARPKGTPKKITKKNTSRNNPEVFCINFKSELRNGFFDSSHCFGK